jgi:branched-chain amino acid transport system ATP-binding protein
VALLETQEVNVRFGGHHAVRDVDLVVDAGIVTGLIGPNGAGKTTTFNVITGLQETTGGRVVLEGEDISGLKAHKRARLGIARTFQRLEVFGSLTARENLLVAAEIRKGWSGDKTDPTHIVEEIIERVGIGGVADERVDAMPTGLARLVELGRALATQPKVLLLDEPASGLDDSESESCADLRVDLAGDGMAVLLGCVV